MKWKRRERELLRSLALSGRLADRLRDRVHVHGPWAELIGATANVARLDALVPMFLHIRNRQGHKKRLLLNNAQCQFARQRSERNIILKARQLGMTTYIAARFFLCTLLRPGTVTLQVAHSIESAEQIFRIVYRFLAALHPDVTRTVTTDYSNVREIAFAATDSRYILDSAGNRNAGRGLTIHNLHASEVALWPGDPRETMAALLAAVPPDGTVELESAPHGLGNYFHREWLRARSGEAWTPHFFPWWVEPDYKQPVTPGEVLAPLTEDEQLLVAREGLTLEQINFRRRLRTAFGDLAPQEFAENDAECFLASGRPVFDVAAIEARLRRLEPPLHIAQNGSEMVWLQPEPGRGYIIGADVAEGTEHGDYSAAVVVDAETGLQCAELLAHWPVERFAEELARLGARYNTALLAVERNNQGLAVLTTLRHLFGYPRIYQHPDPPGDGWPMTVKTKPWVIGVLQRMLREAPEVFRSPRLLEQCRSFAYGDGGEMGAQPGMHDDLVIAAAIAFTVRSQAGNIQLAALDVTSG